MTILTRISPKQKNARIDLEEFCKSYRVKRKTKKETKHSELFKTMQKPECQNS